MARITLFILCLLLTGRVFGQKEPISSDQFSITGPLEKPIVITLADLKKYPDQEIGTVKITNHRGEYKKTYEGLRGIPIRTLLDLAPISTEKPKDMSTYYFVFRATDGYCNVYSWNELYNTDIGNHVYILTTDGTHELAAMPERILVLCTADIQTGRRLLKGLASIEIKKAE